MVPGGWAFGSTGRLGGLVTFCRWLQAGPFGANPVCISPCCWFRPRPGGWSSCPRLPAVLPGLGIGWCLFIAIAIWGGQNRQYAATKFILYTALASLLILVSGLALALSGDQFTLNLSELTAIRGGSFGLLCYLGF